MIDIPHLASEQTACTHHKFPGDDLSRRLESFYDIFYHLGVLNLRKRQMLDHPVEILLLLEYELHGIHCRSRKQVHGIAVSSLARSEDLFHHLEDILIPVIHHNVLEVLDNDIIRHSPLPGYPLGKHQHLLYIVGIHLPVERHHLIIRIEASSVKNEMSSFQIIVHNGLIFIRSGRPAASSIQNLSVMHCARWNMYILRVLTAT